MYNFRVQFVRADPGSGILLPPGFVARISLRPRKKNVRPTVAPSLPEGEFMNALVIINIFHVDEKSSLRFSVMSH